MKEEEQVEKIAKDIYATGVAIDSTDIAYGVYGNDDHFHRMARKLYTADYRKQSDVVREFVKKIKDKFFYALDSGRIINPVSIYRFTENEIDELAAEFGAEVEE